MHNIPPCNANGYHRCYWDTYQMGLLCHQKLITRHRLIATDAEDRVIWSRPSLHAWMQTEKKSMQLYIHTFVQQAPHVGWVVLARMRLSVRVHQRISQFVHESDRRRGVHGIGRRDSLRVPRWLLRIRWRAARHRRLSSEHWSVEEKKEWC